MICSSVYRLFFIFSSLARLRENSSFHWQSFPGAGHRRFSVRSHMSPEHPKSADFSPRPSTIPSSQGWIRNSRSHYYPSDSLLGVLGEHRSSGGRHLPRVACRGLSYPARSVRPYNSSPSTHLFGKKLVSYPCLSLAVYRSLKAFRYGELLKHRECSLHGPRGVAELPKVAIY